MSELDEMADADFFELLVTRFTPEPSTEECRIETVQELDERLAPILSEQMLAINLNCVSDDADWGSFLLLLCGERALIHLMEGPCISARDPSLVAPDASPVRFRDDAGFWHEAPFEHTISREQGLRALRHWLSQGETASELSWTRV